MRPLFFYSSQEKRQMRGIWNRWGRAWETINFILALLILLLFNIINRIDRQCNQTTLLDTWAILSSWLSCVVFVFNVPPTAKVIWRQGHGLKSHPTDWWTSWLSGICMFYNPFLNNNTFQAQLWAQWMIIHRNEPQHMISKNVAFWQV